MTKSEIILYSYFSRLSSVAKAHASSPPGFAMSDRIPPGFSRGRVEQSCNSSGITLHGLAIT